MQQQEEELPLEDRIRNLKEFFDERRVSDFIPLEHFNVFCSFKNQTEEQQNANENSNSEQVTPTNEQNPINSPQINEETAIHSETHVDENNTISNQTNDVIVTDNANESSVVSNQVIIDEPSATIVDTNTETIENTAVCFNYPIICIDRWKYPIFSL